MPASDLKRTLPPKWLSLAGRPLTSAKGPEVPAEVRRLGEVAQLAAGLLRCPIAVVELLDAECAGRIAAAHGLPESERPTYPAPHGGALCGLLEKSGDLIAVADAARTPQSRRSALIRASGARAYLGAALRGEDGTPEGMLCCMDRDPRLWRAEEKRILRHLADFLEQRIAGGAAAAGDRPGSRAQFLAHFGHEVRTPLAGMVGAARLLSGRRLDAEASRLAGILDRSSRRLNSLVLDALELSSLDIGQRKLCLTPEDPGAFVARIAEEHRAAAEEKGISLVVEDASGGTTARIDTGLLGAVLNRLICNAIKFTETGTVHLKVNRGEDGLTFEVRDTGIGIDRARQEIIFEAFEHTETDLARPQGGTSLGLNIVRRAVELMGGTIRVEGDLGQGTGFRLSLPDPEAPDI